MDSEIKCIPFGQYVVSGDQGFENMFRSIIHWLASFLLHAPDTLTSDNLKCFFIKLLMKHCGYNTGLLDPSPVHTARISRSTSDQRIQNTDARLVTHNAQYTNTHHLS